MKRLQFSELVVNAWRGIYPDMDVDQELAKMEAWLDANPSRMKKNFKRFAVNWLNRTQWQIIEAKMKQAENYRNASVGTGPKTIPADPQHMQMIENAIMESRRTGRSADEILAEAKRFYRS